MSPPVNDSITNEPVNQGEDPVPHIERALAKARLHAPWRELPSSPPREPLTVEVTLNPRDSAAVEAMAEEEYRTPAQQVGWIVSQWLKAHRAGLEPALAALAHGGVAQNPAVERPMQGHSSEPRLIPVYHRGDGSAGSGCGKVGLLFARPLEGTTIGPGDVFKTDETPWTKEDGPLTCCQCGGAMVPSTWTYEL